MNIFILSRCPIKAAQWQCDKHVVKMALESAQMLSTVVRLYLGQEAEVKYINKNGEESSRVRRILPMLGEEEGMWEKDRSPIYWGVHHKHPCTIWTSQSMQNWSWHIRHALELCDEYERRYKREHKSKKVIDLCSSQKIYFPKNVFTKFPLAMPEEYKSKSVVQSYRTYYVRDKIRFAKWNYTTPPPWWKEENCQIKKPRQSITTS